MESKNLPTIAIISPGYKPVPDVCGGAVEHLITQLINQNEKKPHYYFELYTIENILLNDFKFDYCSIIQIKDFRKTFFLRGFSFLINYIFSLTKTNKRYNYFARKIYRRLSKEIAIVLIENDVNIFKQICSLKPKRNLVYHMHNDFDTVGEMQKTKEVMSFILKESFQIWTVSDYLKRHLNSISDVNNIRVLNNCVNKEQFAKDKYSIKSIDALKQEYNISKNTFVILYSGRILPQKGVYELLTAIDSLPNEMDVKLMIVGDNKSISNNFATQIQFICSKKPERFIFTGFVHTDKIPIFYCASDVVVIPSLCAEAFCLVALEAMSCGKPIIATKNGALADVLSEESSILIDDNSNLTERIKDSIILLYNDINLRKSLAEKSYEKSKEFFNEDDYFKQFCYLTDELLKNTVE